MKRIVLILVLFCTTIAQSQEQKQEKTFEKEVYKISKRIEVITKQQKDSLKQKVVNIDERLKKGEITKTTADTLKKEVAAYHARRIEKLVGEQERLLQLLVQDKTNGKIASEKEEDFYKNEDEFNVFSIGNKTFKFNVSEDEFSNNDEKREERWKRKNKHYRSTTTQFVFAMGINNVLINDNLSSLNSSNYQVGRSRFYELGWTWKTRITPRPGQFYVKYGVSFLWNNLRLEDNQVHVKNGDQTEIQTFANQLSESRLRHVQMNFPVHFEWDFSKNKTYRDGKISDRTHNSFRLGIGGFAGFKLGTRQYLEYRDDNNVAVEEVQYDNYNMNVFNYGISSYFGYRSVSFYVKYDLNPLFQNTNINNISMGLRLDLD